MDFRPKYRTNVRVLQDVFENIKMKEPVQLGTITVKECGCPCIQRDPHDVWGVWELILWNYHLETTWPLYFRILKPLLLRHKHNLCPLPCLFNKQVPLYCWNHVGWGAGEFLLYWIFPLCSISSREPTSAQTTPFLLALCFFRFGSKITHKDSK